jgi:hypothetical protein
MRTMNRLFRLLTWMLLIISAPLPGCTTLGETTTTSSPQTATLQGIQDDYYNAELQTQLTEDALDELSVSPTCDLRQAYNTFAENAERMGWSGKTLLRHADRLHYGGRSYIVESGQLPTACPLPGLRQPADQKAEQLGEYFDAIADNGWEVKRAYRELEFDLDQIKKHLCSNLRPVSIEDIDFLFRKAQVDAENLKYALELAQGAIDRAKAAKKLAAQQP